MYCHYYILVFVKHESCITLRSQLLDPYTYYSFVFPIHLQPNTISSPRVHCKVSWSLLT